MEKMYKILFQIYRSLRLLLDHFGLEDNAAMVKGEFACISRSEQPYVFFRGSYLDCLYEAFRQPDSKIITAAELELAEQIHRLHGTEYDDEYRQMLHDNRLVDRELRRRKKVRRKRRGRGRPFKKRQVWVYTGRSQRDDFNNGS